MYALKSIEETLAALETARDGLSDAEAAARRERFGANELPERKRSLLLLFLRQFKSVLVFILLGALALSLLIPFYEHGGVLTLEDFIDAIAIGAILLLNALLGFFEERKAERAIALLRSFSAPSVRARRAGGIRILSSRDIVPGDILLLEEGDRISADGRIIVARNAAVDEASLTGESKPMAKQANPLRDAASLADQTNMVFRGTVVTRGHLEIVVTATGGGTEIGKIAQLVSEVERPPTPLESSMARLGRWLGIVVLVLCGVILVAGVLRGLRLDEMLLAAASLAVSAVPEGLPAVVTVSLAIGVQRMIRRRVLTRELQAIETLGSVTVICTDKTGTITENEMEVQEAWTTAGTLLIEWGKGNERITLAKEASPSPAANTQHENMQGDDLALLLQIGASCNNAHSLEVGDPTEIALLEVAQNAGVPRLPILEEDVAFSSEKKYMVTTHPTSSSGLRGAGEPTVKYLKGAAEVVVDMCTHLLDQGKIVPFTVALRGKVIGENEAMASRALRVLAMAYQPSLRSAELRPAGQEEEKRRGEPSFAKAEFTPSTVEGEGREEKRKIVFVGLIGMLDPPRDGVKEAIAAAREAGIRTIIITGDHSLTARAIGEKVGVRSAVLEGRELESLNDAALRDRLKDISIFARVSPVHKVKILEALQGAGEIVAMGGDGVNDAPALKRAHVGFAMGKKGTDVARETAQIVLTDDHFATVVEAIEEGRTIYDNIRKFVVFLLRANFDELLVVFVTILLGFPLPLLPIHLLLINLVTDSLPAIALALEKPEPGVMQRPPRDPRAHILHGEHFFIVFAAIIAATATFQVFFWGWKLHGDVDLARTLAFTTAVFFELMLVMTCRSRRSLIQIGFFTNLYLLGAVGIGFLVLLTVLYTPLAPILHVVPLTLGHWALPVAWGVGALLFFEVIKGFRKPVR